MRVGSVLAGAASFAFAAVLAAQGPGDVPRRVAAIGRIDGAAAPVIDGDMADRCWASAPEIGELVMVEPWEGRVPPQRTVVRLLHDRDTFYIGLWCDDSQPGEIRASMRARDALLDYDDRVEIMLDPFENRRTAYFFQIGAGGSLGDILISGNGRKFDKPWDAIWRGAARVTADGWVAEIAIPFRSLPRLEGASRWGFNIARFVSTRNEEYRWASALQSLSFYRASECGTIESFGEVDGGVGVELVPYAAVVARRDRSAPDPDWSTDVDGGGETYVRLTPSLTLATTVFTDFAETEDDSRQINLDRFPLFFPEKRDFFLDGTSYFQFGAADAGDTTFLPFFTRRIGLAADGTEVPLLAGVKVTGEAGPLEIGLLDVATDRTASLDHENLAVGRVRLALREQTTVGLLATNGDPTSDGGNTVVGVDFNHREPAFVGDLDARIAIDALASTGDGTGDGESFGILFDGRGREWEFAAGTRWVSDDFEPSLGFVRRRGVRQSAWSTSYRPRVAEGASVRRLEFEVGLLRSETWEGQTRELAFRLDSLGLRWHSGDSLSLFASREFDRVEADFTLFRDSVTVAAGDYWRSRVGARFTASLARPWSGYATVTTGDFFDGRSDGFEGEFEWRASAFLHGALGYDTTLADLGDGRRFTTHLGSARLDLFFSPAVSLQNLVQFDNESNDLGWQSRLRWIHAPGRDLFAVVGTAWHREDDGSLLPTDQELALKLVYSLRL